MRLVSFQQKAFQEYQRWVAEDKKVAGRIGELIMDILRNPFTGIGKPEPLKHDYKGLWSRRITGEHRLIYSVTNEQVIIISCYLHYA